MKTMRTAAMSIEEEDALRRILAHHQVPVTRELVQHLGSLISWVHEFEQTKSDLSEYPRRPMPMISLLSTMGIFGSEAIGRSPSNEPPED